MLKALYEQLSNLLFDAIRNDIFAIRAPSSGQCLKVTGERDASLRLTPVLNSANLSTDRLLNTILHGADVVCQVSIREGYEIKVSEAIDQGQWVIGTRAGGIPLQIRDGVDGRLVPPRNPLGATSHPKTIPPWLKLTSPSDVRTGARQASRKLCWTSIWRARLDRHEFATRTKRSEIYSRLITRE